MLFGAGRRSKRTTLRRWAKSRSSAVATALARRPRRRFAKNGSAAERSAQHLRKWGGNAVRIAGPPEMPNTPESAPDAESDALTGSRWAPRMGIQRAGEAFEPPKSRQCPASCGNRWRERGDALPTRPRRLRPAWRSRSRPQELGRTPPLNAHRDSEESPWSRARP
jgi:hypothetical protein